MKAFLDNLRKNPPTIGVVGDICIDEYYQYSSIEISPEAPIPVYKSNNDKFISRPGMAANVAYQLNKFAPAYLFSFLTDHAVDVFFENGIRIGSKSSQYVKHIPIKRRFYHEEHQLSRWDIEQDNYGTPTPRLKQIQTSIFEAYDKLNAQINIISDYNKGFFNDYNKKIWLKNFTLVDPKNGPASYWEGCTVFKPNAKEAKMLTGEDKAEHQLNILLKETKAQYVIITQGGDGVIGKSQIGESFKFKPNTAIKANSVIGAGDCFVAMLALAISQDLSIEECIEIAFKAGGLYVQRKHNQPLTYDELLGLADPIMAKFVEPESLSHVKNLVFTNGCFDFGLTKGHVCYLQEAKKFGDKLVVAINSDDSVKKNKGENRPLLPLDDRMHIVAALDCVDYVISFNESTPLELIERIKPSLIVKGGDYQAQNVVGKHICPVKIIETINCVSTSQKINYFLQTAQFLQ